MVLPGTQALVGQKVFSARRVVFFLVVNTQNQRRRIDIVSMETPRENRRKRIVIALGGNAILKPGQEGRAEDQFNNVRSTCQQIVRMIEIGHQTVITHGNGPQVGAILLQNEEASRVVSAMSLDICGAESQGLIGYMIQQSLRNLLEERGIKVPVVTVVTQVLVDEKDSAFENPTKPVGPFYDEQEARELASERGFTVIDDSGRGWRRVVPSPDPEGIIEEDAVKLLVESGTVVIASGGGGIPVVEREGKLIGVEAVIDKDLAGERLATAVKANILLILTGVDGAALNYGTDEERFLDSITVREARQYYEQGHFAAGSMGPKVLAAIRFLENGGESCIIASLENAWSALQGEAGTRISI